MINIAKIHNKLTEAIRQSGLTQKSLADKIGIKQQTVQQYVSGRIMPALDTFAKLCAVLDLYANDILCVSEYETEN